jgi:L-ascorbate metabolism protein UlaG (beta-lactamase superfamily)
MKITFYGHASIGIEVSGKSILVDPFISANPRAGHISFVDLKPDYIFLTHAHQDHTLDVEGLLVNNPEAIIVSNAEIVTYYLEKGFKGHIEVI